jgi:phosphoribosylanthranilate isomerase
MNRVRVKVCGITSFKDLLMAVDAGVDAVGFVVNVPQSPRNLSINESRKLIKSTPIFVETVVVTVPKHLSQLKKISKEFSSSIIQVHGLSHLHKEIREELPDARLIASIQAASHFDTTVAVEAAEAFEAILLDSYVLGKYGGTGMTNDWELGRRVREAIHPKPLILAGGLTPENVKQAINVVKPYAVDVSSGVESSPRIKDRNKTCEFVKNAKEVDV